MCLTIAAVKYLFKLICKGHDCIDIYIREQWQSHEATISAWCFRNWDYQEHFWCFCAADVSLCWKVTIACIWPFFLEIIMRNKPFRMPQERSIIIGRSFFLNWDSRARHFLYTEIIGEYIWYSGLWLLKLEKHLRFKVA